MFNIIILALSIFSLTFLAILFLILQDVDNAEYDVTKSEISEKAEKEYVKEFPNYTVKKLKQEIESIANILVDNQESNRYTEVLREKAHKDDNIKKLKNAILEDVDIVKYQKGSLKAKVNYYDRDYKYSMVFNLSPVSRGRVFLNKYKIYKDSLKEIA